MQGGFSPQGHTPNVISFGVPHESSEFKIQSLYYRAFLEEVKQLTAPLTQSLDLGKIGSSWCQICDPRLNLLAHRPVANDLLMDKQLTFETCRDNIGQVTHGEFSVDRLYCAGWSEFPSCQELAQETAQKLVSKLARFGHGGVNHVAREVSYKVQISYYKGRVRWADKQDLEGKITYIPQLIVLSKSRSSSTQARLCIIPNRPVWINARAGAKSYNSFVRGSSLKMPPLSRFYLGAALSLGVLFLDFTDSFGSLKHSYQTAKQSIVYCLKTEEGELPCYDLSQSKDGILYPLLQTSSSYGAKDAPALSQRAVSRMVEVYREHCPKQEVDDDTLEELQRVVTSCCYVDDSFLSAQASKVLTWSASSGTAVPPFPSCSCKTSCYNWKCPTLIVTSQDMDKYDCFVKQEVPNYLLHLASSFLKIANFSRHRVKHIKANNLETQKVIDASQLIQTQTPTLPEMPHLVKRPSTDQLQEEIQKGAKKDLLFDGEDPAPQLPEEAAQLGKVYKEDDVYLKTTHVYIGYFRGRSKQKSPHFNCYQKARDWCEVKRVKVSKLTLSSLGGQMWDVQGRHLVLVRSFIKEATRLHLLGGPQAWDTPVNVKVEAIFWKAVEAYFLLCHKPHPRSNLFHHPAAKFYLLCGSDASTHLQAATATLVSYLYIDGKYRAKAMHISLCNYINHTELNSAIPMAELLAAQKGIANMINVLQDLESFGVIIPKENILFTLDARTVLLQLRTRGIFYQKKIQALILRIQCSLAEANLTAFENLGFISQKDLPNEARYHADIISKSKQEHATAESILKDNFDLHDLRWIEEIPPWEWSWVKRDYGVPAIDDKVLVEELGVHPDYLGQLREHLEKPTVIHQSTIVSSIPTSSDRVQVPNQSGQPKAATVDIVVGSRPRSDSPLDVQVQDPSRIGLPAATSGTTSGPWKEEVIMLFKRKWMYQLGKKGAISIIGKVICFVNKLKTISSLPDSDKSQYRKRLKEAYLKRSKGIHPWLSGSCCSILCGLSPNSNCGNSHTSTTPTVLPKPKQKKEAHHLFTPWSPTGCGLGIPPSNSSCSDSCQDNRVMAFDLLCCMFSSPSSLKGFTWAQEDTRWGQWWVGRGRKQRDWQEGTDYVPTLRSIDPTSIFGQLCLQASHSASIGQSSELPGLFLNSLRIHVSGAKALLREVKRSCPACNIAKARAKRQDTRMKQQHMGPSGQLIALGRFSPGFEVVVCDLTGPVSWRSADGLPQTLYFLVCVSAHWGETKILPIQSKHTEDLVLGLKTLALQKACQFTLIYSDQGSEFSQCQNSFSPMKPLVEPEPLVTRWFSSLITDSHKLEMAGLGAFILFGAKRHSSVSKVETRIGSIKRALRCFHVFGNDATASSLFEIHYLLALAQYILDSRPLLIKDGKIWSLQTLRSLMLQGALMEHPQDGVEATAKGSSKQKVESVCLRLVKLRKSVTSAMMEHCLPSLLDTVHRRERAKTGLPVDHLKQGDVIFDSISYLDSGCVSGNIGRVASVGKSSNHVLISKALLNSAGPTFKQQIISRPTEYCHFIAAGSDHSPVKFEEDEQIFDITKYLPQETIDVPGLFSLPLQPSTPAPALTKAARVINVSKSGRLIKKPQY